MPVTSASPAAPSGGRARATRVACALIALCAPLLVYATAELDGPFLFDDFSAIQRNPSLERLSLETVVGRSDTPLAARPIPSLSFFATRGLFGGTPGAEHRVNLALHALAALCAFLALERVARRVRAGPALALGGALCWALHPMLAECVVYATQRTEILAGLFQIAAAACFLAALDAARPRRLHAAVVALALCGVLSKESAAALPLVLLVLDRALASPSFAAALRARRGLYAALAATWLVPLALAQVSSRSGSVGLGHGVSPLDYLLFQGPIVLGYLRDALWPAALVLDHGTAQAGVRSWPALGAVLALAAGAVALFARRPRAGAGPLIAVLALAPSSSVVPIVTEIGADRRVYVALLALAGALALGAGALAARLKLPRAAPIAALFAAALALGLATRARTLELATEVGAWRTVVERAPHNARGSYNLGKALFDAGDALAAEEAFRAALALDADYAIAHDNLGALYARRGDHARALPHFERAAALAPSNGNTRKNLGLALLQKGDPQAALPHHEAAARLLPDDADAQNNLGVCLLALGRPRDALLALERALALAPDDPKVHGNLARALSALGETERAAAHAARAR